MLLDLADTVQKLINSPPGQLVTGATLGGIVWKAFEKWEGVASDNDKIQVWMWLAQPNLAKTVERWPETFARLFDRVFGTKHISWRCFRRSCIASIASLLVVMILQFGLDAATILRNSSVFGMFVMTGNVFPDYACLWETRVVLRIMRRTSNPQSTIFLLVLDAVLTAGIGLPAAIVTDSIISAPTPLHNMAVAFRFLWDHPFTFASVVFFDPNGLTTTIRIWLCSACLTSIWLWLYAGSGFLLKAARRFDIGFQWFNRHMDIERKPLSSIGLVAGALVAVVYWTAVIVARML